MAYRDSHGVENVDQIIRIDDIEVAGMSGCMEIKGVCGGGAVVLKEYGVTAGFSGRIDTEIDITITIVNITSP